MSNYVIYHHDDPDGHVAGAILYNYLVSENVDGQITMFAKNYNDQFIDHKKFRGTTEDQNELIVYITDISFTDTTFDKLYEICCDADVVFWFDHHKSSEIIIKDKERIEGLKNICDFAYLFNTNACGALLSWMYTIVTPNVLNKLLNNNNLQINNSHGSAIANPTDYDSDKILFTIPEFLYYIDVYDRWTKEDPDADAFICGMKASKYGYKINDENLYNKDGLYHDNRLFSDNNIVNDIISAGNFGLNYYHSLMNEQATYIGIWNIGKYKIAYKNAVGQSWNFNDLIDSMQVDAGILGHFDPKYNVWRYSVYSHANSEVKANRIAELFGGGGHPGAAGFSTKICFFDPENHWTNYNNMIVRPIWNILNQTPEGVISESKDRIWLDGNKDKRWKNILKQYLNQSMYIDSMHTNYDMEDANYHLFVFIPNESAIDYYQRIFDRLIKYVLDHDGEDLSNKVSVFVVMNDNDHDCDWDIVDDKCNTDPSTIGMLQTMITFCKAHGIQSEKCEDMEDLIFKLGGYVASVIKDINMNK